MLSEFFSEHKILDDFTDGQLSDGEPPTCYNIGLGARGTDPRRILLSIFFSGGWLVIAPAGTRKSKGQANVRSLRVWKTKVKNAMAEVVHFDSVS